MQFVLNRQPGSQYVVREPVVLLPGWGFDGRIATLMQPPRAWFCPDGFLDPATVLDELAAFLNGLAGPPAHLVGWSMGGYLALEFARRHPRLLASVSLLSLRRDWPQAEVAAMRSRLHEEPVATLAGFYRRCFLGQKRQYNEFTARLQDDYLQDLDIEKLDRGLAYLQEVRVGGLPDVESHFLHGGRDIVAPLAQAADGEGGRCTVLASAGHALLLAEELVLPFEKSKQALQKKFSAAAASYDAHAKVQKQVVDLLAPGLPPAGAVRRLLEIGCGTGSYTAELAQRYPAAEITVVDFSRPMLEQARARVNRSGRVRFLCGDAESFLADSSELFDLITSNATLQWFADLPGACRNIARRLAPGGILWASLFGPGCYGELGRALRELFGYEEGVMAAHFPDRQQLTAGLDDFAEFGIDERLLVRHYRDSRELLRHIKKTGTGGFRPARPPFLTRERLQALDQWFGLHHGGCQATYQIYLVRAAKGGNDGAIEG